MIQLYGIPLGDKIPEREEERYLNLIPQVKRKKTKRFRFWQDAQRTILGYSLINYLLTSRADVGQDQIKMEFDKYGKPHLIDLPYYFNISHSGDWIVCAVGDRPLGVDVERIGEIDIKIADRFFARPEVLDLLSIAEEKQMDYFFTLWTLKESYIKAEGQGLSIPIDTFWFRFDDDQLSFHADDDPGWNFRLYPQLDGYKLALCSLEEKLPDKMQIISREELL